MFTKILPIFLAVTLLLSACSSILPRTGTEEVQNTPPDQGVSPSEPVETPSWQPAPGDENLVRGEAEVLTTELLTLESFPPQYVLHLTGNKGVPCDLLRIVPGKPDAENRIKVEVYLLVDPAGTCIQMLESFDVSVPLGSYPAGKYTVWVNDSQVAEFTAP